MSSDKQEDQEIKEEQEEWSDEEFEKRKQYIRNWLDEMTPQELRSFLSHSPEEQKLLINIIASGMYRIQYDEKFQEFKNTWLKMKKLYLEMIELLLQDGTTNTNIKDAQDIIKDDCKSYKLGITETLFKYIDQYFVNKEDFEYLEEFKRDHGCQKPEYNKYGRIEETT